MGLETTEILMAVEDEFHVRIEGEEAYRIQTVGDLNQFVIARRGASVKKGSCGTLRAFLQVRYALSSQFSVPERNIRPSTDLRALLPWKRRRTEWRKLQRRFPSLPDLSPSRGSQTVIVLGGFAVACALVVVTIGAARDVPWWKAIMGGAALVPPALILYCWCAVLLAWITKPIQRTLHPELQTAGSVAKILAGEAGLKVPLETQGGLREDAIRARIRQIIAERLGMEPDEIKESDRFGEELRTG